MAIQNVTITFKAKKTGGADVIFNQSGGGTTNTLSGTAGTRSAAEALIQAQLDASVAIQQGNVQDQQDASNAFGG